MNFNSFTDPKSKLYKWIIGGLMIGVLVFVPGMVWIAWKACRWKEGATSM